MTRLMKSRVGSSGNLKTDVAPLDRLLAEEGVLEGPEDGEYTSLLTSKSSPMSRFGSIEPVGLLKAWTAKVGG